MANQPIAKPPIKSTQSLVDEMPLSNPNPKPMLQQQQNLPWLDDLSDDLQSMSFGSSTDITSSSSSSGATAVSSRAHLAPPDSCWDAVHRAKSEAGGAHLTMSDLRFLQRLGSGDIGSVYLAELKCSGGSHFAAKVMDKKEIAGRNKEGRAKTEREILEMLEHPFLPTLYAAVENGRWLCLLTEFCPGGDLHVLRQRQPGKRFDDSAVRFYASEVVVALEYLHMMGIVYRDLKPENVLVRSDGHIMLTDFDLSLKCDEQASTAQLVSGPISMTIASSGDHSTDLSSFTSSSCILPNCIVPAVSCFHPKRKRKKKLGRNRGAPEFVSEPVDVRSMSFVGTHEYLAPEIVSGEGHGSAVDWWTLGIFVFELLYGITPFKGIDNDTTLANIVARALEFPKEPSLPAAIKDLISGLLVKDPARRMGSMMGAAAIKHHSFFHGVNWALLRCTPPPYVPPPFTCRDSSDDSLSDTPVEYF